MFNTLYKAIVRSHLDSCSSVWSPYKLDHIKQIESVQRWATKQIPELKGLSYEQRLKKLKLPTLLYRRVRGDLIETFKILHVKDIMYDENDENFIEFDEHENDSMPPRIKPKIGKYDPQTVKFLKLWRDMGVRVSPRNNKLALFPQQAHCIERKNSFAIRVVKWWNDLPNSVVLAPNVNTFKNRLDKYFHGKDIVYEFDKYLERLRYESVT